MPNEIGTRTFAPYILGKTEKAATYHTVTRFRILAAVDNEKDLEKLQFIFGIFLMPASGQA